MFNFIDLLDTKIQRAKTIDVPNRVAPNNVPIDTKAPSDWSADAEIAVKMSGDPLEKARRVTPAIVSGILSLFAIFLNRGVR